MNGGSLRADNAGPFSGPQALHRSRRNRILPTGYISIEIVMKFRLVLFGLAMMFVYARWRSATFRARLAGRDLVVQLRTADGKIGR